jgi:RNA polymerase sigma factor for flagellar operon FliA
MPTSDLFTPHLPLIERVVRGLCRRKGLPAEEAEDFEQDVKLKLWEDDCARLRKFDGRSEFKTYLTTVVARLFVDAQRARLGKWRPSEEAKRLGAVAVHLETLTVRDGFGFEEAVESLRRNHGVRESPAELAEIAGRLPARAPRRFEGEETLERLAVPGRAGKRLRDRERAKQWRRIKVVLGEAMSALPAEEQLILKMRFADGFTVARIAKVLGLPQRQLYSRIDKAKGRLRGALEERGVDATLIADLLDDDEGE